MKVTTFTRLALASGVLAVAASGLVSSPAFADPAAPSDTALVGLGSDTTQDVMDALATVIGNDKLVSYTSTIPVGGSHFVKTRSGGSAEVPRAKGSGDGWKMLQVAEGSLTSKGVNVIDLPSATTLPASKTTVVGQIDYARSSSTQGTQSNTGEYVDIPFARDVVGIAVNAADAVAKIPNLSLGASTDSATTASLQSIYRCKARYVYLNSTTNAYVSVGPDNTTSVPANATAYEITPLVPAFGSGTAKFFLTALGFSEADGFPASGSGFECIKRVKLDGSPIQEHEGAPVAERTNAIGIYSIGQYVAQKNTGTTGVTDKTSNTVLVNVDGIVPITGSGAAQTPNADNWPAALKRFVFNIVSYRKAVDPDSATHKMFVGTDSLVCTNSATISKMGFSPLTAGDGGDPTSNQYSCGSINNANRYTAGSDGAAMTTAATVTNAADIAALSTRAGTAFTVNVNGGVATHDMGGTVQILDAAYGSANAHVLGSTVIGTGASVTGAVQVTPIAAGTTKLYAYFVPALGGIKVTNMSAVSVSDASFASITPDNPSTTTISVRKPANVGGTVRVVVWVQSGGANNGGTVELYKNDASIAGNKIVSGTLSAGESGEVLSYSQNVASQKLIAKFIPADTSVGASSSSAVTVALAKATPTLTLGTLPAAPNGFVAGTNPIFANAAKWVKIGTTVSVAPATDVITATAAHGLTAGSKVYFTAGGLPGGLAANTPYYVIAGGLTTTAFKVSATLGGTAVNITTAGTTVVGWKSNVAPKVAVTLAAPAGVTLNPTGSIKVYIGSTASDKLHDITSQSTGLNLAAGATPGTVTLTGTLSKADTWTWITGVGNPNTLTSTTNAYLIIEYSGDGAFNTVTLSRQLKVTP